MGKKLNTQEDNTLLNNLPDSVVEALIKDCKTPGDLSDLLKQITKRLLDGMLEGEMTNHLGYGRHDKLVNVDLIKRVIDLMNPVKPIDEFNYITILNFRNYGIN